MIGLFFTVALLCASLLLCAATLKASDDECATKANEEHKTIYDADGWSRTDIYLRDHKVICTIQTTNYKNIQSVVTYDDIGNILGKYISGSKSVTLECHSVDAAYGLRSSFIYL